VCREEGWGDAFVQGFIEAQCVLGQEENLGRRSRIWERDLR
jgi:hypothetical protein